MDQLSQGRSLQSLLNLIAIIVKLSMPNWTNGCMSDDNLTQLKPPLFKIRRFLKEVEAEFEQKKSLFLSKISSALDVSHPKGKRKILEEV